tara:strand:+ start:307 stop:828 length:522 start_codon:yes stop_codon:yes gene_type:complete
MDDRSGRPEQIRGPALRSMIKTIDLAIENGTLDPNDREEVIKMFIPKPTLVVDTKAGGGMMDINNMVRPIGYQEGGPVTEGAMKTEGGPLKKIGRGLMSIIKNFNENAFAPERREDGGAEKVKMFNFLWKKGYSQPQISAILSGEIKQEDVVPARQKMDAEGNLYIEEEKFKG